MPVQSNHLHVIARDLATRAVVIVGLAGIALIHLLDSIGKYGETRYLFWMYIALIVGCLGVAGSAMAGYVLSRTTGLPGATDDIGNWTEPLGLASLFVEGAVVAVSSYAFAMARRVPAAGVTGAAVSPRRHRRADAATSAATR